jgi:2',3'-cyclic-nucleotide 2'-phosphodiesterase (5'-nucleotidase family)
MHGFTPSQPSTRLAAAGKRGARKHAPQLLAACCCLAALLPAQLVPSAAAVDITLLHYNDWHHRVEPNNDYIHAICKPWEDEQGHCSGELLGGFWVTESTECLLASQHDSSMLHDCCTRLQRNWWLLSVAALHAQQSFHASETLIQTPLSIHSPSACCQLACHACLPATGGLPRMKAFIDSERSADPDLVLLNAGDDFVGTTWDRKFALDSPAGFMNSLAPDVMVGHQGARCAAGWCMSSLGWD